MVPGLIKARILHPASYSLVVELWLAMHCHLPSGIFIQVSVQRSWVSMALPFSTVPLPTQLPVAIAVLPNTVTLTSLISLVCHVAFLTLASVSALLRSEERRVGKECRSRWS